MNIIKQIMKKILDKIAPEKQDDRPPQERFKQGHKHRTFMPR